MTKGKTGSTRPLRWQGVQRCSLCSSRFVEAFYQDETRAYFRCRDCAYIFVDPADLLPPELEKARYDKHQNSPDDPAYRHFLSRLADPLLERLGDPPLHGLDYGSGPGPTLSVMLEEKGHTMTIYDPFYAPNSSVFSQEYDFITCTEAIEHFHNPGREWRLLLGMLKPGGWMGLMTVMLEDTNAFAGWYYKNHPTHVGFFSRKTFRFLADRDGLDVVFVRDDTILFQKP